MKYEWRKEEKEFYLPKKKATVLTIPKQKYLTILGKGDPNQEDFSNRVSTLFPLAYGIKQQYRKYCSTLKEENTYTDFTVFPLEGIWTLSKVGQNANTLLKSELEYQLLIKIPDFIPDEVIDMAFETVKLKKPNSLQKKVSIVSLPETKVVQILHIGSFNDEPASFALMDKFCKDNNLTRTSYEHQEIYLSNFNRTAADKLKTVLRYQVK